MELDIQKPGVQLNSESNVQLNSESNVQLNSESNVQLNSESNVQLNSESNVQLNSESNVQNLTECDSLNLWHDQRVTFNGRITFEQCSEIYNVFKKVKQNFLANPQYYDAIVLNCIIIDNIGYIHSNRFNFAHYISVTLSLRYIDVLYIVLRINHLISVVPQFPECIDVVLNVYRNLAMLVA